MDPKTGTRIGVTISPPPQTDVCASIPCEYVISQKNLCSCTSLANSTMGGNFVANVVREIKKRCVRQSQVSDNTWRDFWNSHGRVCARSAGDEDDDHGRRTQRRRSRGSSPLRMSNQHQCLAPPSHARLNTSTRNDEVRKCNTKRKDHDRNLAWRLPHYLHEDFGRRDRVRDDSARRHLMSPQLG